MKTLICLLTTLFLLSNTAQADPIYKRIPFTATLTNGNTLYVSYDFTEKKAIQCSANPPLVRIDFIYKGHEKSAMLPVILQTHHIPNKKEEVLADVSGQFTLSLHSQSTQVQKAIIHCSYLE